MSKRSCAATWLRRGETALWVVGLSLLGWALAATSMSREYQARQERAFFPVSSRGPNPAARSGADPLVLGRLEIPRIGVAAIVREGADDATLAIAVGHIPHTARPGEPGNMALAGHRDSFFRALRGIRKDDGIRMVTPERIYEYVVDWTQVVEPEDTWVLDSTDAAALSLVTCFPFDYVGHAPRRFVVRASLVGQVSATVARGGAPGAGEQEAVATGYGRKAAGPGSGGNRQTTSGLGEGEAR